MSTNGSKAAPSRDQIIREATYVAAIRGHYDTSEEAQRANLLTISVVAMEHIVGDGTLLPDVTHQFCIMIDATGFFVTLTDEGYKVEPYDQTEHQRQERELRESVLDAALWYMTGEGAGYYVGAGPEARSAALKELLEDGPEDEEREEGDPVLHPVIREEAPDLSLSLAPGSQDEEGPAPLRQWAVEIGPLHRCTVVLFGYDAEDNSPVLVALDAEGSGQDQGHDEYDEEGEEPKPEEG